jgi:hypothetical protein
MVFVAAGTTGETNVFCEIGVEFEAGGGDAAGSRTVPRWKITNRGTGRRRTWLGSMPREQAKRELVRVIHETGGNLRRAAHLVGWNRQHLYDRLHLWGLVPEVAKARAARAAPLRKTRRRLRMDEMLMGELVAAVSGMSEEQILVELEQLGLFSQPELVAAYLASRAVSAA